MDSNLFSRASAEFVRDEELCERYAQFASHLVRWQFKIIYWLLFAANLIVLFLASWTYTRGQKVLEKYSEHTAKRRKELRLYIFLCLGCVLLSTTIVIMEAFALLALQFCDGENLMSLYWSTWTMLQVGSLIAMTGIILALVHSLRDRRHPPWALALGTPVLVIAGLLHLVHDCTRRRVKKMRKDSAESDGLGPSMSQAPTISASADPEEECVENTEGQMSGELVGFTIEGGPIIRLHGAMPSILPPDASMLGRNSRDQSLIAYSQRSVKFLQNDEVEKEKTPQR